MVEKPTDQSKKLMAMAMTAAIRVTPNALHRYIIDSKNTALINICIYS